MLPTLFPFKKTPTGQKSSTSSKAGVCGVVMKAEMRKQLFHRESEPQLLGRPPKDREATFEQPVSHDYIHTQQEPNLEQKMKEEIERLMPGIQNQMSFLFSSERKVRN